MKKTRTPAQTASMDAFKTLAAQLSGEIKEDKPEVRERLAKAQALEGIARYSPLNQLLLLTQCPQVSEVGTYNQWKERGYQVRKGEHSLRIIAPHQYNDKEGEEKTGFHSLPVFNRDQVDLMPEEDTTPKEPKSSEELIAEVEAEEAAYAGHMEDL